MSEYDADLNTHSISTPSSGLPYVYFEHYTNCPKHGKVLWRPGFWDLGLPCTLCRIAYGLPLNGRNV